MAERAKKLVQRYSRIWNPAIDPSRCGVRLEANGFPNIQFLSFDAGGNLYAYTSTCDGVAATIAIFAPQASTPSRIFTNGLEGITSIAGMATVLDREA
jgi:hypothetical protein